MNLNYLLPITVQIAEKSKIDNKLIPKKDSYISVKKLGSDMVDADNFYKPISKIIIANES